MTSKPFVKGLSADLLSFYRLFRRACSASVLHRNAESVALRNLYRPTFRRAGLVYMRTKDGSAKDTEMLTKRKAWLDIWNRRMDNTLSLLYNSSHTRGLSHQLTKFLGHFIYNQRLTHWRNKYKGLTWIPQLPPDSPLYKPPAPRSGKLTKQANQKKMKDLIEQSLAPLREVVRMAEGRDGISFGGLKSYTRVRGRKPPPRLSKLPR